MTKICRCGKSFLTYPSKILLGKGKYCSKRCSDLAFIGKHFSPKTELKKGVRLSEATKKKMRGRKPHNFKGVTQNDQGYILMHHPTHPLADRHGQIREHRFVVETHTGLPVKRGEVVHHVNEVRRDNRIQNLILFRNNVVHRRFHMNLPISSQDIIFDGRSVTEGVMVLKP